ncbi:hypothetical protein [Methylobacterium sp. WL69]|uniref:hypothetical protein n=1 Tax=Methylobacterium sp. WL69 TaxID=2603893 RepID=UPI001FEFEFBC|nr:hypothetical protein [Methylobacterium sp. WL69]
MPTPTFVLQALDPTTGSPRVEAGLCIADIAALRAVLGLEGIDKPIGRATCAVEPHALKALGALSDPPFEPDPIFTRLEAWSGLRAAPYLIHTGYELPLMLEGRKPLAVFGDVYPCDWLEILLARFAPFVREGRIVRRTIDHPFPAPVGPAKLLGMRDVYFALPNDEWRI